MRKRNPENETKSRPSSETIISDDDFDRSYFDLDRNRLVEELDKQTALMGNFSMLLAEAKKETGEREAKLELVEAKLMLAMRRNPDAFDLPASNVDTIKAAIIVHERYQKANGHLIRAKHQQDLLQGHVNTIAHRKKVMEDMLELLLHDFWSMPKMPNEARSSLQEHRRMKHVKGRKRD